MSAKFPRGRGGAGPFLARSLYDLIYLIQILDLNLSCAKGFRNQTFMATLCEN